MNLANMKRSETTEQINLFNWAKRNESILPELALMYHVPNEGKRTNGNILKAMGLKSGVPNVVLPVPNGGSHGLYMEMKFGNNKPTKEQEAYMRLLREGKATKRRFVIAPRKQLTQSLVICRHRDGCHYKRA